MKRVATYVLLVIGLSLGNAIYLEAQHVPADRFLAGLSKHPVGDEVERDQGGTAYQALTTASPAEVQRLLPELMLYTHAGGEPHARRYAVLFLTAIAIRPDGAELLSSRSDEIASLILDADPGIQKGTIAIADYVMASPTTNIGAYVGPLKTAIQRPGTQQDAAVGMVGPLLFLRSSDPGAVQSVLDFMHRSDLTVETRRELVRSLSKVQQLPNEVIETLVGELNDPDVGVRVAAVVAFADSTTSFHAFGKERVAKLADDPQEDPRVRELAREAVAGKTGLNPNVLIPHPPAPPDKQ